MPDLSRMRNEIEWEITHPNSPTPIAFVRKLRLGPGRVTYFRAVTFHDDASKRELIGYWGTLEEATQNVHGLFERHLPADQLVSTDGVRREPLPLTQPKAPPLFQEARS